MLKQRIAASLLAATAMLATSAGPALANGDAIPGNATPATQNAVVGQSVSIAFGTYNPYTPGGSINWSTVRTSADERHTIGGICSLTWAYVV